MEAQSSYIDFFHLLREHEDDLPKGVKKTIDFFNSHKLWFQLSRNIKAESCRDAANKRFRLGHIGIPLEHELKSYFGKFTNAQGFKQYVVLHCKGNQELDFEKVNRVINAKNKMERLTNEELLKLFSFDYGLVNPFSLDPLFLDTPILQVFEKSLEVNLKSPYTMMTNAGDLTWAVEFKANQLINAVHHFMIGDIILNELPENGNKTPRHHKIGVLTGNSPEAGILLWRRISQIIRDRLGNSFYGDISLSSIVIESIPDMGMSMELDLREEETWNAVRNGVISLCKEGATIICISCNTTQYFNSRVRRITSEYRAKYISIAEVTLKYLEENKIKEFALLGTKYVTSLNDKWTAFGGLRKFKIDSLSERDLAEIQELAFKVKLEGINGAGLNKLRDLLNHTTKSENIVIALTEISILLESQKKKSRKGRNYIDTLELLAEAVADKYLKLTGNI